ncbi:Crp/Fnr family transcriptional regulator [Streptomyces sp. NPDC051561]|uniref:Crp/Fnr family transcriptional regulator n=1 Tax=Streptomyces sp. NPDC051561 TaxID=3365658 RepID=UPI0037B6643B
MAGTSGTSTRFLPGPLPSPRNPLPRFRCDESRSAGTELPIRKGRTDLSVTTNSLSGLPPEHRPRLAVQAQEVAFPAGTRLFNEGQRADRFRVVRQGSVALDMHVPGRRPVVIETLGPGQLVGWSWLFEPHTWQLGATAVRPVAAAEFDAVAVRELCASDPELGAAVGLWVAQVLAHRLHAARIRLLDLYGPAGSGLPH